MSIMENQMDNLMEYSAREYEQFCEDLDIDIFSFIIENGYSWTVEEIVKEYREKYTQGFYVSNTCLKVIEHFKGRLERSTGIKTTNQ